jgi:hypothetical protein
MFEQWERWVQFLTRQKVSQATVKTADDRLAVIWSEKVESNTVSDQQLEQVIVQILKKIEKPFQEVFEAMVNPASSSDQTSWEKIE